MSRSAAFVCATGIIAATLSIADSARASDPMPWRLLVSSAPFPPAIGIPMGVYDSPRHRVLAIDVDIFDRPVVVYAFDPSPEPLWSTLATAGTPPSGRYLASIVVDPMRDRLLVIGSYRGQAIDVWALTLSGTPTWQKLATSGDPPARYGHSTIYDPVHDRVVMFGGMDYSYTTRFLSEAWSLSLTTGAWSEMALSGAVPGGREGHGALYDPERQRMVVFGGHFESGTRGFWNDTWELSLGDSAVWNEIAFAGAIPGARSAFGTTYDPVRHRMLVHSGVNSQSGVEPDNLWALSLDGTPAWTQIVTTDTLRGRSYPIDVYDPDADRLLACGGAGYPQTSELSLSAPVHWNAVLPTCPLLSPGARSGHAVLYDSRRDRFLVVGGYSPADSATWIFRPETNQHWQALRTPPAPGVGFYGELSQVMVYDSLGDRVLMFDGWQTWSTPAALPGQWAAVGPHFSTELWPGAVGSAAGVVLDTRRNRLIVTGGYVYLAHSAGYSLDGVWALSLGAEPAWSLLGNLPTGSYGHAAFYDPIRDRLVIVGGTEVWDLPRTRRALGAVAWTAPVDSVLQWTRLSVASDAALPGPPNAHAAYAPETGRLFLVSGSIVRVRSVDSPGPWTSLDSSTSTPAITNAIAYDPIRDQLLALFASPSGSVSVDAWALAVGPLSVSVLATDRTADAVTVRLRSVTAWGRDAALERREEGTDWREIGPLAFGVDGTGFFRDQDIHPGHGYFYRVRVTDGTMNWHSEQVFVPDSGSLRLVLYGARPNPSAGTLLLFFSLPAAGPARLEVFDVHGRRRVSQDVGSLGPGMHALRIEESAAWSAGVYYARLQRGGESRSARLVLVR